MVLGKTELQDMERARRLECLDGLHLLIRSLQGQKRTGFHRTSIEENGAGATIACVATDMGPREAAGLADEFDQQGSRLNVGANGAPVDGDDDRDFV